MLRCYTYLQKLKTNCQSDFCAIYTLYKIRKHLSRGISNSFVEYARENSYDWQVKKRLLSCVVYVWNEQIIYREEIIIHSSPGVPIKLYAYAYPEQ